MPVIRDTNCFSGQATYHALQKVAEYREYDVQKCYPELKLRTTVCYCSAMLNLLDVWEAGQCQSRRRGTAWKSSSDWSDAPLTSSGSSAVKWLHLFWHSLFLLFFLRYAHNLINLKMQHNNASVAARCLMNLLLLQYWNNILSGLDENRDLLRIASRVFCNTIVFLYLTYFITFLPYSNPNDSYIYTHSLSVILKRTWVTVLQNNAQVLLVK